jgi:formyl-CoA transferase
MMLLSGVLAALFSRARTGKGQVVDVALYEAMFNCMESLFPEYDAQGYVRERSGSALPGIAPSNLYACRDGSHARIDEAIGRWTAQRSLEEVLSEMEKAEVPAGRIYTAADIARDPHYAARGMLESIVAGDGEPLRVPGIVPKLSATPGAIRAAAPKLGEHTESVLRELGYGQAEIDDLKKRQIL